MKTFSKMKIVFAASMIIIGAASELFGQTRIPKLLVTTSDSTKFDTQPDSTEFRILKEFYTSTGGPRWLINTNWLTGNSSKDFAKWYGITVKNGDVVSINLNNNNLSGTIPNSIYRLFNLTSISLKGNRTARQSKQRFAKLNTELIAVPKATTEEETNLPMWVLGVGSGPVQKVDWRTTPATVQNLVNSGTSALGPSSLAIDDCGRLAFYIRQSGNDQSYQLNIYTDDGVQLTNNTVGSPLRALNSASGNTEIQIVRVPSKVDEWYIIYSEWQEACKVLGSASASSGYCPARVVYARVKYNVTTKVLQILQRNTLIGTGYIQGKAVSRTVDGDISRHYLYLVKRLPDDKMAIHRYIIDQNVIGSRQESFSFSASKWFLSIASSSVELSPTEELLVINNRNEASSNEGGNPYNEDIILFNLKKFTNSSGNPKKISIPDLVIIPDGVVIQTEMTLAELAVTKGANYAWIRNKMSDLEMSPSGRYLYVVGGGYPHDTSVPSWVTYILQIDLQSSSGTDFDVRIQAQSQGKPIAYVESIFKDRIHFTKGGETKVFGVSNPDNPIPTKLTAGQVDLSSAATPNVTMLNNAKVSYMPENIDGYDYLPNKSLVNANFTLNKIVLGTSTPLVLTPDYYSSQSIYKINWGDGSPEQTPTTPPPYQHSYATVGSYQVSLTVTDTDNCPGTQTTSISVMNCSAPSVFTLTTTTPIVDQSIQLTITGYNPALTYSVDWGDGKIITPGASTVSHNYTAEASRRIYLYASNSAAGGCSTSSYQDVTVIRPVALCAFAIPVNSTGQFKLDKYSGQIVFDKGDPCLPPGDAGCMSGQTEMPQFMNVVSAAATTFADSWNYDFSAVPALNSQPYENGQKGKWRPSGTYEYSTPINYQANDKAYLAGRYTLSKFNWQYPGVNTKNSWVQSMKATKYSPNGDAVEEVNALGIPSSAKFGYGGALPYLVAKNAVYGATMFESFEFSYNATGAFEDGVSKAGGVVSSNAHSGKSSFQLTSQLVLRKISANGQAIQVRFWASGEVSPTTLSLTSSAGVPTTIQKLAQVGIWSMWEATVTGITGDAVLTLNKLGYSPVYLDDIRIVPVSAEVTCYVYEPRTLQLVAIFDDQHYGLFYQYNDEGKLVRKRMETERGVKTIQETQYNTAKKAK